MDVYIVEDGPWDHEIRVFSDREMAAGRIGPGGWARAPAPALTIVGEDSAGVGGDFLMDSGAPQGDSGPSAGGLRQVHRVIMNADGLEFLKPEVVVFACPHPVSILAGAMTENFDGKMWFYGWSPRSAEHARALADRARREWLEAGKDR